MFSLKQGLSELISHFAPLSHPPTGRYFSPTLPSDCFAIDFPRRAISPGEGLPSSLPLVRGVAEAALYCAHRTSTVSPCAFCEQEGHLAAPLLTAATREAIRLRTPSVSCLAGHRSGLVYGDNDEEPIAGRE